MHLYNWTVIIVFFMFDSTFSVFKSEELKLSMVSKQSY